jgi:hypothetical protein
VDQQDDNLSLVITNLMKGILYRDEKQELWEALMSLDGPVRDYLKVMGLDVEIYESDGFAYLKTREIPEEENSLPRLVTRRQLSYPVSLILALLRRKLTEHDTYSGESRLIIDKNEVTDMVSAFFPSGANEVKFLKRLDSYLLRIQELGFIRFLGDKKDKIEVRRILKAFIDAQWLSDFNDKMEEYAHHGSKISGEGADQ